MTDHCSTRRKHTRSHGADNDANLHGNTRTSITKYTGAPFFCLDVFRRTGDLALEKAGLDQYDNGTTTHGFG